MRYATSGSPLHTWWELLDSSASRAAARLSSSAHSLRTLLRAAPSKDCPGDSGAACTAQIGEATPEEGDPSIDSAVVVAPVARPLPGTTRQDVAVATAAAYHSDAASRACSSHREKTRERV